MLLQASSVSIFFIVSEVVTQNPYLYSKGGYDHGNKIMFPDLSWRDVLRGETALPLPWSGCPPLFRNGGGNIMYMQILKG